MITKQIYIFLLLVFMLNLSDFALFNYFFFDLRNMHNKCPNTVKSVLNCFPTISEGFKSRNIELDTLFQNKFFPHHKKQANVTFYKTDLVYIKEIQFQGKT